MLLSITKSFKREIIHTGLNYKEKIKRIPILNKIAKLIYIKMRDSSDVFNRDSQCPNINYSSLSVAKIKELMDQRYVKKQAYNITYLWDQIRATELNKRVIELISPATEKKILEIGCGIGSSANYLSESECGEFIGTDLSEVAINQANQTFGSKLNFKFIPMDAMDLKFEDNYFDVVLAKEVIEHLPEPTRAIKETFRVLNPTFRTHPSRK